MGRPLDTSDDARRRQLDAYRAMSSEDRLRLADEMSDDVRSLARSGIRARYAGSASEDEVDAELARILLGAEVAATTAEDLVLAKLEWAAASGSERQIADVAGIVAIADKLDIAYVDGWAAELGVADAWRRIRDGSRTG